MTSETAKTAETAAIEMRGIDKAFGPVRALVNADLVVAPGTIHGLVGQNGAGKSTIIKVLAGIYRHDAGSIRVNGQDVPAPTPAGIETLGVHFIHQDRLLSPTSTLAEAIFLRHEPRIGPFIDHRAMNRDARALLKRYFDLDLTPTTLIRNLTTAQQKVVQITRALAQDAKVLVLDEPTASLVQREVDSLFQVLKRLRDEGIAIVFISHYMQEIKEICDRVTVMRNGEVVGTLKTEDVEVDDIIAMMIDRDVAEMYPPRSIAVGKPVLEVSNLSLKGSFDGISLTIRAGEIVGLTGLVGSGAKELIHCLFGLKTPDAGEIQIDGERRSFRAPIDAVNAEMAMIPEDRRAHGVAISLSVAENVSLASLKRYCTKGFVSAPAEQEAVDGLIRDLSIMTPDRHTLVRNLSGGNQQKVAVAKWLSCQSKVYLLDEPTVAVDVAAKVEIYTLLNRLASEGAAILFNSSDLEELVGMCDRVLVVYRGKMTSAFSKDELDSDRLLAAASGAASADVQEVA